MPPVSFLHDTGPAVTTIPGVEIVRVGTWHASTGPIRVTADHLAAIVAAESDPEVDRPVLKPGHIDPRFDGQPSMGTVANLRVEMRSPGQGAPGLPTLVGDLVNVPAGLARVLPVAWPNRSAEISWGVLTSRGRHVAALTGLALLGLVPPAVKGLKTVEALYSAASTPANAESFSALSLSESAPSSDPGALGVWVPLDPVGFPVHTPPPASEQHGPMPITEQRLREILNLTAEADVEAAVRALVAPPAPPTATVPSPTLASPPAPTAPAPTAPASPAPTPTAPAAASPTATTAPAPPTPAPPAPPTPPTLPPGMSIIADGVLAELQRNAAAGAQAAQILQTQENERVLTAALSEGRLTPADLADRQDASGATVPGWRTLLAQNPQQGRAMLNALQPRVSTVASTLGADGGVELDPARTAESANFDAWENQVFGIALPTPPAAGQPANQGGGL